MLISRALMTKSKKNWLVDLRATCHICNDQSMFAEMTQLDSGEKVTLGDRSSFNVAGERTINIYTILTNGTRRACALKNVL